MQNVIQAATIGAQLSAHRRAIMDLLVGHPLITTAEYETALNRTLACQDIATLQKWYRNTIREIARREETEPETALVAAPITYATGTQKEEIIRLCNTVQITRSEKTAVLLTIDRLDYADAKKCIGGLWAKILSRSGSELPADGWSVSPGGTLAYSAAA